jgi:hypothetical protein
VHVSLMGSCPTYKKALLDSAVQSAPIANGGFCQATGTGILQHVFAATARSGL